MINENARSCGESLKDINPRKFVSKLSPDDLCPSPLPGRTPTVPFQGIIDPRAPLSFHRQRLVKNYSPPCFSLASPRWPEMG